jgi:Phage integrase family
MVRLLRHRQTKGPDSARPHLNRRATPRLHPTRAFAQTSGRAKNVRSSSTPHEVYRFARNRDKWRANSGPEFSSYVFPSSRIPKAHMTDYKKAWHKAATEAGLKSCRRIYDLRATFASRANSCKASGLTVAHLLGHASTQILPTYVKPLDENTRVLIEALDSARLSHKSPEGSVN